MTNPCSQQQEHHCQQQFDVLFEKLDRLDEAIRGNGKPGIQLRLARLETAEKSRSRLIWIVVGVVVTVAVSAVWNQMFGG